MITKEQIKRIYSLGAGLGLVDSKDKENDMLHELIHGITEKSHVSELSNKEFQEVQKELINRLRLENQNIKYKKKPKETVANMMNDGQQRKAWQLIYRLQELQPSSAAVGERMAGALKKVLNVTANPNSSNMFRWVTFVQGVRFIETLKKFVDSAEKKSGDDSDTG